MIVRSSYILNNFLLIISVIVSRCSSQTPKLLNVSVTEEGGLYVVWSPLENYASNPILGYKIKIWEVKQEIERKYKLINGDSVPGFVEESITAEVFNKNIPSNKPRIFRADPNSSSLEINYIKPDVLNEIRVQSYKQNEDGEYSEPWRLKVFKEFGHNAVGHRHMDKCMVTVTSQIRDMGGIFPHIYNSYL